MEKKTRQRRIFCFEQARGQQLVPLTGIGLESLMLDACGALFLHSSVACTSVGNLAFTGASGVGKTTQAMLWKQFDDADILAGDRSILVFRNDQWWVYGAPFDGSSGICRNEGVLLDKIIVLAQGDHEALQLLSVDEAFKILYTQMILNPWDKVFTNTLIEQTIALAMRVPVYRFGCRKGQMAVDYLKRNLYENKR